MLRGACQQKANTRAISLGDCAALSHPRTWREAPPQLPQNSDRIDQLHDV
jgi:hypothetical protein